MGSLALARAELESLAGRGMLDEPALLDLAEVRWRTGDLAGAGEAANALLARDRRTTPWRSSSRPSPCPRSAGRARRAGSPRAPSRASTARSSRCSPASRGASIWPADPVADPGPPPGEPASRWREPRSSPALRYPGSRPTTRLDRRGRGVRGRARGARRRRHGPGRAPPGRRAPARARLRAGRARGDRRTRRSTRALALVAGDALRLLGRESEALAAFDMARGHVHSPGEPHVRAGASLGRRPRTTHPPERRRRPRHALP